VAYHGIFLCGLTKITKKKKSLSQDNQYSVLDSNQASQQYKSEKGRAIAQAPRRAGFEPRSGHVGFVVDKVSLEQDFSEYFGFPCQFSCHRPLIIIHHLGLVQ
jgi:hypothetical protein